MALGKECVGRGQGGHAGGECGHTSCERRVVLDQLCECSALLRSGVGKVVKVAIEALKCVRCDERGVGGGNMSPAGSVHGR